ncbi:DUF4817 domain-containing protein [Trichonephila clavipes]|nr:DUF4817 domain-containing protein [Trichonephila clavipes]
MLVQRLTLDTPPAATPDQHWQHVEVPWTAVLHGYIQSLFDSMPRCVLKHQREASPHASTITYLLLWFFDTASVADKKQSGRASIMKTKVADVDTSLQRNPMKRPSVYLNIITEFISLLNSDERYLGCSNMVQRVAHHGTGYLKNVAFRNNTHTLDELETNILHAVLNIKSHTPRQVSIKLEKSV